MFVLRKLRQREVFKLLILIAVVISLGVFQQGEWRISGKFFGYRTQNGFYSPDTRQNVNQTKSNDSHAKYNIPEVEDLVNIFLLRYNINSVVRFDPDESYNVFLRRLNLRKSKGKMLIQESNSTANNSLDRFHRGINQHYMYDSNDELILTDLMKDLITQPIVSAEMIPLGSQLKILLTFADGSQARFKPMRTTADADWPPNLFFYEIYERHISEIAAFQLDRVLGFNKAVPTVGRALNITRDLASLLSNKTYVKDVYTSPGGNLCFIADCLQYCGKHFPFCGHQDVIEGSVSANLPPRKIYKVKGRPYLYSHSYLSGRQVAWQTDQQFCEKNLKKNVSLHTLLEFVDLSIFDFLIGNMDRHYVEMFIDLGSESFVPVFDNGRGFGRSKNDCMSCLAQLIQCCQIRLSTLAKLVKLYRGPDSLSQLMRTSLNSDPLSPILPEPHLDALDRRVGKVIKAVSDCIHKSKSWEDVVVEDVG